jgi:hypothetical protein
LNKARQQRAKGRTNALGSQCLKVYFTGNRDSIMNPLTPEHVQSVCKALESLPDDVSDDRIEQTAARLEKISYEPLLIRRPPGFLRITRDRLLAFIHELATASGEGQATEQDLNLLLHQFRFLQRLRQNDPEAWDEISELWEED